MPTLEIRNMNRLILKVKQSNTILKNIQENYLDWMHACGGKGRCTTCRAEILEGIDNIAPPNDAEKRMTPRLKDNERLTCQAIQQGDLVIHVPEQCQFPHINYTE